MPTVPYHVVFKQQVPRPLGKVFEFFSQAENLEIITPPWLNFKIRSVSPSPIQKGSVIQYALRLHGVPLHWTSEITEWEPPHRFVDLQVKGPYKLWHHEHCFEACDGGTLITDSVTLALPFGMVGRVVYRLRVGSDIQKIFTFRREKIRQLFG